MSMNRNTKIFFHFLSSKVSLLALVSLTVWLGLSALNEARRKHEVREEIARLQEEIFDLDRANSNLASLIDSFEDPDVIEAEAKKRLHLKKPGEEVAVILRDKNDTSSNIVQAEGETEGAPEETNASKEPNNLLKWWRYITNQ